MTVGTFDGFHRGHQQIVAAMQSISAKENLRSRVITFDNHPLSVVAPEKSPKWALPRESSIKELEGAVDEVVRLPFTAELASRSALNFMNLLREEYGAKVLVMGYDNTFGSDRPATRSEYEETVRRAGLRVVFVDALEIPDGCPVSSSRLRRAIARWDFENIMNCCGRWPVYSGRVASGRKLGRQLGFPTLNIILPDDIVPLPAGVYAAAYSDSARDSKLAAVLSVGNNPTVGDDNGTTVELHVPDVELGEMYDREVRFMIGPKIREIRKFDSLQELSDAIARDVDTAKTIVNIND